MLSVKTIRRGVVLGLVVSLGLGGIAAADPGDLDETFGGDGTVNPALGVSLLAVAPGNGLWVSGPGPTDGPTGITRLRPNGQLDPTFGEGGELLWSFREDGPAPATIATDVTALPGGGVQISGNWCATTGDGCGAPHRSFVARFDESGAPDVGFGQDGVIGAPVGAFSLTSLGDDTSVHACRLNSSHRNRVIVRRHLDDGSLDPAFSDDGRAQVYFEGNPNYRRLLACSATADGGTLVAVRDGAGGRERSLRLAKLTRAGVVDVDYGDAGRTTVSARDIEVESAAVSSEGAAWFAGWKYHSSAAAPRVLRLTADGERDSAFGRDGIAALDLPELTYARHAYVAARSDGSAAVTGELYLTESPYLAMLTPEGDVDTSFGDGGLVTGYADGLPPTDIAIDRDDRMITANGGQAVIRFLA